MGKMTFGASNVPYTSVESTPIVDISAPTAVIQPSFKVVEQSIDVIKPSFSVVIQEEVVQKPVFVVKDKVETVERSQFVIHESQITVEKPVFVTQESHLGVKADWTLRILLGISILVNIWHSLR